MPLLCAYRWPGSNVADYNIKNRGAHAGAPIFTIFLIKLYDDQQGVKCTNYRTILLLFYYKQEVTKRESENASLLKIP